MTYLNDRPQDPARPWQMHTHVPSVHVRVGRLPKTLDAFDIRDGVMVENLTAEELAMWVADRSRSKGAVPLGDWIFQITHALGVPYCTPCARRRAWLNNLLGKKV